LSVFNWVSSVRLEGLEPPTYSSVGCRSIQLSYRRLYIIQTTQLPEHQGNKQSPDFQGFRETDGLLGLANSVISGGKLTLVESGQKVLQCHERSGGAVARMDDKRMEFDNRGTSWRFQPSLGGAAGATCTMKDPHVVLNHVPPLRIHSLK
jgi:hypothetical protein